MLEMMTTSFLKKLNGPGLETDPEVFQKLLASDGASGDYFGRSVAVTADGLTLVVGAFGNDAKGTYSGSAYIFTKQANGSYLETQKLLAVDGASEDNFAARVATSSDGSTVVVGAHYDDDKGNDSGSVYIFTKQSNGSYLQTQKLLAFDGAAYDYFGWSVDISADGLTVLIGAADDDDKGFNSGSAYIFTKQANGSYLQTQKLVATDGATYDFFGYSAAVSGDGSTVVVGAFGDDDKGTYSGSAYIFTKQASGSYLQTQKLVASDGAADEYFGYNVIISTDGSTIVVGAPRIDVNTSNTGSAYIFTKQANGSYLQTQKLLATDGAANDWFGVSAAASGDGSIVVIGAYYDDDKGNDSGSAYVFTKQTDGNYLQTQKLVASDGAANDCFGYGVAVSNTSVVIGAYGNLGKGGVYVY